MLSPYVNSNYVDNVRSLAPHFTGVRYVFKPLPPPEACDDPSFDFATFQNEYWIEILERAHAASTIAILRGLRWYDATFDMARSENFFGFVATLRGLLESAADSHDSLRGFALTVAKYAVPIVEALLGRARGRVLAPALEEALIHFLFARKLPRGSEAPDSHRAKEVREYVGFLDSKVPGTRNLYTSLCEVAHSAHASIEPFFLHQGAYDWTVAQPSDGALIADLLESYGALIQPLLFHTFNPPLLALRILNELPAPSLHTPMLATWDFSGIPAWLEIENALASRRRADA